MKKTAIASIALTTLLAACGGGGGSNSGGTTSSTGTSSGSGSLTPGGPSSDLTSPKANTAPVAKIGALQGALTGKSFALDGSASSDADGDSLTYAWTIQSAPANSTAALSDKSQSKPTFKPDLAGDYMFALVVSDGKADSTRVVATVSVAKATWKDADCSHTGSDLPACATEFSDNQASVTVQHDRGITAMKFETRIGGPALAFSQNTGIKGNRADLGIGLLSEVKLSDFEGISFKSRDDGTGPNTGAGLPYVTYSISKECDGTGWSNLITNLTDMVASGPDADGYVTYTARITDPSWKSTNWSTPIPSKDGTRDVLPANGASTAKTLGALLAEYPNACIYNWPNPYAADPTTARTPAVMLMLGNSANVSTAKYVWVRELMIGAKSIF